MSYFLWIEDFDNDVETTADNVLGAIFDSSYFVQDKRALKRNIKQQGVFIELSFQDGLNFISKQLNKIDYIILDINLPVFSDGGEINEVVLALLKEFQGYKKQIDISEDEALLTEKCKELKEIAGFYLYTQLIVELGFPKDHILFCSNHGENTLIIQKAFKDAKIALPTIYQKSDNSVKNWVKDRYENPYSVLRRGIIEGCQYIDKNLDSISISFNTISEVEKQINIEQARDYLAVLENFLPLRKPDDKDKVILYKLFIRTLSHEWEAADPKKIRGLAWIMKNVRNWITHNSALFSEMDEAMLAYLFIINMRVMFDFDELVQNYEEILLSLFEKEALTEQLFKDNCKNKLLFTPISKAYCDLQNLVSDESDKGIKDAFNFRALANNIQESLSSLRDDKRLFVKVLYQLFWLINSYPRITTKNREIKISFNDFNYTEKPYVFELARRIYNRSFC